MSRKSPVTHPRGRLPARVYWFRRGVVVLCAVLLVFGVSRLFGGGSDPAPAARLASGPETSAPATPAPVQGPVALPTHRATLQPKKNQNGKHAEESPSSTATAETTESTPLAQPTGPCDPADLAVAPGIGKAAAGDDIPLTLELTGTATACTFKVSPETMVVKVTSGKDRIWSTQDCPAAIPKQKVVVRSGDTTEVTVDWGGHRSTPESCSGAQPWAKPGYYHVHAAVLGSVPSDKQFRLTVPPRHVVTKTASPKTDKKDRSDEVHGKQSACGGDNAC